MFLQQYYDYSFLFLDNSIIFTFNMPDKFESPSQLSFAGNVIVLNDHGMKIEKQLFKLNQKSYMLVFQKNESEFLKESVSFKMIFGKTIYQEFHYSLSSIFDCSNRKF